MLFVEKNRARFTPKIYSKTLHKIDCFISAFSLEITLALLLNLVRPGERVGYQEVIDRFFSETGLAFSKDRGLKPPDKVAFNRARKQVPVKVCQILFTEAVQYVQSLARQHDQFTWNGFRVYAIDGTRKNLPASLGIPAADYW